MRAPVGLVVALAALAACASPAAAPPSAPVPTPASASASAAPSAPAPMAASAAASAPVSAPASPPSFVPKPPFSIVARASGSGFLGVLPLDNGAAILVAKRAGAAGPATTALLDHDEITPAPQLAQAFAEKIESDDDLPIAAGRWPDNVWIARGSPCRTEQWQGAAWAPRDPSAPTTGRCSRLAPWTSGAAIAVVAGPKGDELRAFGQAPRAMPSPPPRGRKQPKECSSLIAAYHALFAWPTGEIVAVGVACGSPEVWIARWEGGSTAVVLNAEIDPNGPYLAQALSKQDLRIDGVGALPADKSEGVSVRALFRASSGAIRRASIEAHEVNALEQWMVNAKQILGLPAEDPMDGFVYDGYRLTSSADVFVMGHIARGGVVVERLLLRSASSAARRPFVFP